MTTTNEQRAAADHRGRLGASRLGAILGEDPHCTEVQAWLEIRGTAKDDGERSMAARCGLKFERAILDLYEEDMGCKVGSVPPRLAFAPGVWNRLSVPTDAEGRAVLTASPDGSVLHRRKLVQVKMRDRSRLYTSAPGLAWGEEGTDEIPDATLAQCHLELAVVRSLGWEIDGNDVVALFGGNDLRVYHVPWDEAAARDVIEFCTEWWQRHIVEGVAPDPVSEDDCKRLWPNVNRVSVALTVHATRAILDLAEARAECKRWNDIREERSHEVRELLGDAEAISARVDRPGAPPKVEDFARCAHVKSFDAAALERDDPALVRELKLQQDLKAETVKKHSNALHNRYRVKGARGNLTLPSKALAWLQKQAAETTTTNDGDNDQ